MHIMVFNDDLSRVPATVEMLQSLMELDADSFASPWDELKWRGLLSLQKHDDPSVAAVAVVERLGPQQTRIHGYSVWAVNQGEGVTEVTLLRVAVCKKSRRNRIGMRLVNLPWTFDVNCRADVHEREVTSQRFFRGCGWSGKAVGKLTGSGTIRFETVCRK